MQLVRTKHHKFTSCVLLGDPSYPEVERDFLTKISFNLKLESMYEVVESLMNTIRAAANNDVLAIEKIEKDIIKNTKKVFLDPQLIFIYD